MLQRLDIFKWWVLFFEFCEVSKAPENIWWLIAHAEGASSDGSERWIEIAALAFSTGITFMVRILALPFLILHISAFSIKIQTMTPSFAKHVFVPLLLLGCGWHFKILFAHIRQIRVKVPWKSVGNAFKPPKMPSLPHKVEKSKKSKKE
jgi:hypothetical protein